MAEIFGARGKAEAPVAAAGAAAAVGEKVGDNHEVIAAQLKSLMGDARQVAKQDRDRVLDSNLWGWEKDRLHAFIDGDAGLPDDVKVAMKAHMTSGHEIITLKSPQKILEKLVALLGGERFKGEAWQELSKLGNCADLGPDDVKDAFLDEDMGTPKADPEAWLANLKEDWGIEGLDADSALKIKGKIAEIDDAAKARAPAVVPAVERLVAEATDMQRTYTEGRRAAGPRFTTINRACTLLPELWRLLCDGELAKAVDEIEKAIETAAAADDGKAKKNGGKKESSTYATEALADVRRVGSYGLDESLQHDVDNKELQDAAAPAEEKKEGASVVDDDSESKADGRYKVAALELVEILPELVDEISSSDKSLPTKPSATPSAAATIAKDLAADFRAQLDMPETTDDERKAKYELISETSQNFINDVAIVGKRIVEEIFIPSTAYRQLSFKPCSGMGGIAGGRKYVVNGVLYKLASAAEQGSPYQDSFEAANKGAAHDLRGATALFNAAQAIMKREPGTELPHVTLNAVVDYLGFRLQAMPLLPLGPGSLKVGSEDAGDTIYSESKIAGMFEKLAAELGMAPHRVLQSMDQQKKKELEVNLQKLETNSTGDSAAIEAIEKTKAELTDFNKKEVTTSFGIDVEGHIDRDGRPVALDLARVFSPEHIGETKHLSTKTPGSIYVRHLRPELIKQFAASDGGTPLSADALSSFAGGASDSAEMNERVRKATRFLLSEKIPQAAESMDDEAAKGDDGQLEQVRTGAEISRFLHEQGINARHLGLVYHHCKHAKVRASLLQEMVVRTVKNIMRHAARDTVQRSGRANVTEVRKLYTVILNMTFYEAKGDDSVSGGGFRADAARFWQVDIWDGLCLRFGKRNQTTRSQLREEVLPNLKELKQLALRLADVLGIVFSEDCATALRKDDPTQDVKVGSASFFFTSTDIKALDVRVKYMAVVDRVAGELLMMEKDNYSGEATIVPTRLAAAAKRRFKAVLSSTPGDRDAWAKMEELSHLTRLKDRLDALIGFSASTRKSQGLVQMRDEHEMWGKDGATIDLHDIISGTEDVDFRWWVDLLRTVLEEDKFKKVTHLRLAEDVGASFKWREVEFDFEKSEFFRIDLLRRLSGLGEVLRIDTLWVARGSGLLWALASLCKLEVTGQIKGIQGMREADMREADIGRAMACLQMISYGKIDICECRYFVGDFSKVQWPAALQSLNLQGCDSIEGDLSKVQWPAALQSFDLMWCGKVEGDLSKVQWPAELQNLNLSYCGKVEGDLSKVQWPAALQSLYLQGCDSIEGDISKAQWPASLKDLQLGLVGGNYNYCKITGDLSKFQWPAALQTLSLQECEGIEGRFQPRLT
eukprot:g5151.t1